MLKKLKGMFNKLRLGNYNHRKLASIIFLILVFPKYLYRFFIWKKKYNLRNINSSFKRKFKKDGYVLLPKSFINSENILKECDEIIKKFKSSENSKKKNKSHLIQVLEPKSILENSSIISFVSNKYILDIVSSYLGHVPCLTHVNIWYSPNINSKCAEGSQLWHIDHESFKQVKVFLYLNDIDEINGATEIFNKKYTKIMQKKLSYSLLKRKHSNEGLDNNLCFKLSAERGGIAVMDTSSCFHRGSYGFNKPRFILSVQYLPINAYSYNKFNEYTFLRKSYHLKDKKELIFN